MKKIYILSLIFFGLTIILGTGKVSAQIKIGNNGATISRASLLELESTNKGLLIPRMPNTDAIDALNPPVGMMVYITTEPSGLYIKKTAGWEYLSGLLGGNAFFNSLTVTGAVTAGSFSGPLIGNASTATTALNATNALNVNITNDIASTGTVYPTFSTLTPGNSALRTSNTKLSFVPSTGILTSVGFAGNLTGDVNGNATNATDATNASKVNITDDNGSGTPQYITFVSAVSGNSPLATSSNSLTYVPSTGTLAATTFTGQLVGNATSATNAANAVLAATATNLVGGTGGAIPYQSAPGITAMLGNGTAGQLLRSNGTTLPPSWTTAGAGDMILGSPQIITAPKTFTSTNLVLAGSASGTTVLNAAATASGTVTLPVGGILSTLDGIEILTNKTITAPIINTPVINAATLNAAVMNGPALGTPISGVMTNVSGTAAGLTAGTAINLVGGAGGSLPYQSAAGTTAMIANGSVGQILQSNGGTVPPTWVTPAAMAPVDANALIGNTLAANVVNSSLTSVGTLGSLTVTNPISGSVTGNAATASALQTPRNINGVAFDGLSNILVTADANTLTGNTLNPTLLFSSLTSVGTLANLTVTNPIVGNLNGNALTTTNINGGAGGSIPYQASAGVTALLPNGTAGQILQSNGGVLAPNWLSTSGLSVGTATNLAGGATGSIPYQNSAGTTLMLAAGTAGQILQSNGAAAPSWVPSPLGDMTLSGIQTVTGAKTFGAAGNVGKLIIAGTTSGTTTLNANPVAGAGVVQLPVTGTLATLNQAETFTNKTLTAPVMTAPVLGIVASGDVSAVTGNATGLTAGTATNLASGTMGAVPYQTAAGATAMLAPGTSGQVLQSNGAAPPTWANAGTGDMLLGTAQVVTAAKTFGGVGNAGNLVVAGSTSGSTIIDASAAASGTVILPPNGGTLVTLTGAETLTSKTLTTSTITNPTVTTGTFTSPTLVTPALGTPASGVMTNVTGTASGLTSGLATSIAAGAAGEVPYQSGAGTTAFVGVGTAGQVLSSNGAGAPTWINAATGDMILNSAQVVTASKTFGAAGNVGQLIVAGNTSGVTTLNAQAVAAGGTVLLPNTGTLATLAGAEALTNKTINGNTITAGSGTLTLANGSTLANAGAFATTLTSTAATNVTLPTTGTLATLGGTETLLAKTLTTPTITNPTVTTGTFTSPTFVTPALGTPASGVMTNVTGTASGLTSGLATSLAAGVAGEVPYQSGAGTTAFVGVGTAGQVLSSNGAGAPIWINAATGDITLAGTQIVTGPKTFGAAGNVGNLIIAGNTSGTTILNASPVAGAGTVVLPTTGTLATLAGIETLVNKTLTSPVLTTPDLGTPSVLVGTSITGTAAGLTAGNATTAVNIAGGLGGTIPYQTAAGATSLLANGVAGQVLSSNGGTNAPSWINAATGDMTLAGTQSITGPKTFGAAGNVGNLIIAGNTSGTTILNASPVAGAGTVVLPTTGTLATLAGIETLVNKTLTSPVLTTPDLGTPSVLVGTSITGTAAGLTAGNATTAVNIAGGLGGTIPYQTAAGATSLLANGVAGQVLSSNGGTNAPSWINAATGDMTLAGTQSITGPKTFGAAGNVGNLIIAGNTSGTTILNANPVAGAGTVVLPTTGTLATLAGVETLLNKTLTSPVLTTPDLGTPSVLVGTSITGTAAGLTAGNATTAVNIAGGLGGSIPYQTAAGATTLLANGGAGQVLSSNGGTNAPSWINAATGDMTLAGTQSITGPKTFGAAGNVGNLIIAGNTSGTTILNASPVAGAGTVVLPTTGTLATLAGIETLVNKTLTSPVLTTPDLGTPSVLVGTSITGTAAGLTAGNATTAVNIAGGLGGSIPYQTAAGATSLLANGTAGQVLQSNGTTLAPSWVNASAGDMILAGTQRITGPKTFGDVGNAGNLIIAGSVSGTTIIDASPAAAGTVVLPPNGGTLVTLTGNETLTNKILTSPTVNTPTINSATMVTPTLGVAAATSINRVAITQPATGATLTIADGQTLTVSTGGTLSGNNSGDQIASGVANTPAGTVAAVNVQTAINELDTEKAPLASPTFTGTPTLPTGTIGVTQAAATNTTALATTEFVTTADNLKADIASPTFTGTVSTPEFRLTVLNNAPANATAPGVTGEIRIDATYIYVCIATNSWTRAPIASW